MSVQMQQFRAVGVKQGTGEDVSVIIDAATKAAAEVKAEQMGIETTHIVRLKQDQPTPPDEHELFSTEAAEALAGKRTDKLIEEVVPPEEARLTAPPQPVAPATRPSTEAAPPVPDPPVERIIRPTYAAPSSRQEPMHDGASGARAFSFALLFMLALSAGAYFVLVHEPNAVEADEHELIFGEDLFSDVTSNDPMTGRTLPTRDAFSKDTTPSPLSQETSRKAAEPASADGSSIAQSPPRAATLQLQSVVTSHEGRFAVINGKLYKQGAMVAGHKLVSVADDWVLVEKDGKQRVLTIASE